MCGRGSMTTKSGLRAFDDSALILVMADTPAAARQFLGVPSDWPCELIGLNKDFGIFTWKMPIFASLDTDCVKKLTE